MHIIIGLIGMIVGALIVIYSEKIFNAFGRIPFFEKYLGTEGGSRLGYKLVGMFVFFIFLLVLINVFPEFIRWVFGPLIRPLNN